MASDKRSLLEVLKAELEFLEKGGYRQTARAAWRPQFIFQDSPTCLNFDPTRQPRPCSDCALAQLVPEESAKKKIPCRYIPLNERGETIDSFYRCGTAEELEAALGPVAEADHPASRTGEKEFRSRGGDSGSTRTHQGRRSRMSLSKRAEEILCFPLAQIRIAAPRLTIAKGISFDFTKPIPLAKSPPNTHAVQHFWLCGNCSADYTLAYRRRIRRCDPATAETPGQPMPCRFVAAA